MTCNSPIGQRPLKNEDSCCPQKPKTTPKESEILQWCAKGKTTAEIAFILNRSENTINFHIYNLRTKFGLHSRHAVVLKALQLGMISYP